MKKRLLMLFLGVIFVTVQALAQQVISGKVSDDDRLPLPGVSVKIKGTTTGTVTGADGNYTIRANQDQVLVFSFLGFITLEKTVGANNVINLTLKSDSKALEEVVVVGYGSQKKANLTGAVTVVDVAKTFGSKPLNDPAKALQGVVPGLTITYGSGGLTSAPNINIRGIGSINGKSQPLILVDNVVTPDLSVINPNDIESISVLKDAASTSIYGARAAFGVVLVKTKSGKKNQKTSVIYSNNFSWNKPTTLPDFADPVPELTAINEASQRSGVTTPELFGMQLTKLRDGIANWQQKYQATNTGTEMILGQDFDYVDGRVYFYKVWDAKKLMLKKYTNQKQHNLRIQGGGEKVGYSLSFGTNHDDGIFKLNPDEIQKYNVTASINSSVNKWLDVDAKMLYRNFKYEAPYQYQSYWYYFWRWGSYFPYGTYQGQYFRNIPAYLANAKTNTVTDNYQRVDLGATFKLSKDLNIRADYTIGRDNVLRHEVGGQVLAWDFWTAGNPVKLVNVATTTQDNVSYADTRGLVNTLNVYATYQKTILKDHKVKVIAGVNSETNEDIYFSANRKVLLEPEKGELNLATGEQTTDGLHKNGAYAGYFSRLNYDYKGKYLLEVNGRYDGSSSFSSKDRWGFFPSASVGYRLSEEKFMDITKPVISDMKFRASYGSLGNQDLGGQFFIPSMAGSNVGWINGSTLAQGIGAPRSVAQSLTWETVTTLDLGTDVRFLKNLLGLTVDWYQRDTKGMLANTSVPAVFGTTGPKINSGNFRNRGVELSLDANYPVNENLKLYGTLTFSDTKTVFTKWDNPSMLISQTATANTFYEGQSFGEIWGFENNGYFTSAEDVAKSASQTSLQNGNFVFGTGDVKYKDLNGDGVINAGKMTLADHGDLKVIGNSQPRYQYGARLGGTWKGFDMDLFIQGVGKRDYFGTGNIVTPLYQGADIMYAHQLDFWSESNPNAFYPRPYVGNNATKVAGLPNSGNNFYPQDKYLLNLAYTRLKNITFGYTLPNSILKDINIQKLRVYVSGQNLAEISNVAVPLDPEIDAGELSSFGRTSPFQRMYSLGLDLTF